MRPQRKFVATISKVSHDDHTTVLCPAFRPWARNHSGRPDVYQGHVFVYLLPVLYKQATSLIRVSSFFLLPRTIAIKQHGYLSWS